jgi:hypothetical protein
VSSVKNLKVTINQAASPKKKKIALYDKASIKSAFSLQLLKLAVDVHTGVYHPSPVHRRPLLTEPLPFGADVING